MEESEMSLEERLFSFARSNILILALLFGGLIFLGIGMIQIMGAKTASVKFQKGADVAGTATSREAGSGSAGQIKVDVEGEVLNPGVYSLPSDARVQDVLNAAGGLSSSADRKAINLAARIIDGQKIYVPAVGETISSSVNSGSVGASGIQTSTGLVSINSGSQSELESLPAIGPVTAQKIINARPYNSLEELVSKKAVGQKTFDKIKDLIGL